jgi:HTH-type transcriptional regulator/antitoxin HigA
MKYEIKSNKAYHETMLAIYEMMDKGEPTLTAAEFKKFSAMSAVAENEDEVLVK